MQGDRLGVVTAKILVRHEGSLHQRSNSDRRKKEQVLDIY